MNKNLLIAIGITIAYAIFTFTGVLHHETWADEAQVWQLCKHLNIPDLINHLHNEGHPSLFYFLVMPFAKLFDNIIYMQIICWAFMCLASFLLLYKSQFSWYTKIAILLSAGFIYFFPIIARSYSILPFLVFLAAILYSKQKEHPILYSITLVAIANTHSIMAGFVSILLLLFIYENCIKNKNNLKINIIAASIIFVGLLALVFQLYDTTSNNHCINFDFKNILKNFIKVTTFFYINAYNQLITIKEKFFTALDFPIILTLFVTYIMLFINLLINNKRLFTIALLGIGFQYAVYIFVYPAHTYVTRIFTAHIILLFCFWILYYKGIFNESHKISKRITTTILLSIFFILTSYNGFNYYKMDIEKQYASAYNTYKFITNNLNKEDIILIDNENFNVALLYYLDRKDTQRTLFSVIRQRPLKYVIWDKEGSNIFFADVWKEYIKYTKQKFNIENNIYVLIGWDTEMQQRADLDRIYPDTFELIYKSNPEDTIVINERHYLYKYIGE